jgi:hypothetical protein
MSFMKALLATTAIAAAFAFAPAYAQESKVTAGAAATTSSDVSKEKEGQLTIEGVTPAQALGAIDTSKLVDPVSAAATPGDPTAKAYIAAEADAPVAPDEKPLQTAGISNEIAPISKEVQAVVGSGARYTTEDLVNAQLAAVEAEPTPDPTATSATDAEPAPAESGIKPTSSEGSPVFDRSINPADWSLSAEADTEQAAPNPGI